MDRPEDAVDRPAIQEAVHRILEAIGEDPDQGDLKLTPARVADMYAELFSGMGEDPRDHLQTVFEAGHDDMVMVRDIPLYSMCRHHLIPFYGKAHVAYIPNKQGQITGLSKLARVVEVLARRPQVQELLTTQIADALEDALDPRGALVVLEVEHLCMTMRGVQKPGSTTVTSAVRGTFRRNEATRAEAMNLIFGRR